MQRFFSPSPLTLDITLVDVWLVHQLTRVLRSQIGEHITLFHGDGSETEYEIMSIDKKSIQLRWVAKVYPETESQKKITLYQAIPNKYEKIEYIIQKWVEIGISRFIFWRSDRSQRLAITENKKERYALIAREAVEQCWGIYLPDIVWYDGANIIESLSSIWTDINICLDTTGSLSRIYEYADYNHINLWVGPEWGWSESELSEMRDYGFIFAHFSKRVFRTETAGVVVSFALLNQ
jgi:16S rRNA (uracil1498-N3)-methyltransferase